MLCFRKFRKPSAFNVYGDQTMSVVPIRVLYISNVHKVIDHK
jgi:hypothetical protein